MTAHKNNKLNIINWSWGCHGKICYDIVHCAVTRAFMRNGDRNTDYDFMVLLLQKTHL